MTMKKATIVRTVLFALVLLNFGLKQFGHEVIPVDESAVAEFVEYAISAAILILSWWKNNSFTQNAQVADRYLESLKNLQREEM